MRTAVGNRETAPSKMLTSLQTRIHGLAEDYAKALNPSNNSFKDVSVEDRETFAKDLVAVVLKAVYGEAAGGGRTVDVSKIGRASTAPTGPPQEPAGPSAPLPQDDQLNSLGAQ